MSHAYMKPRTPSHQRPTPAPAGVEMISYGRLTTREQLIVTEVQKLHRLGYTFAEIAQRVSRTAGICMFQGTVKYFLSGVSSCTDAKTFFAAREWKPGDGFPANNRPGV